MKAIVLVGGYAKRLRPLTENTPKALLPIVGKPIIHYIIEQLQELDCSDEIIISTNRKFEEHFRNYLDITRLSVRLAVEDSTSEGNKLGAIGALENLVDGIDDDVLVVAGDNLFDFSISDMLEDSGKIIIGAYDLRDKDIIRNRFGCLDVSDGKVVSFVEKPDEPASSIISTGIYVIPYDKLSYLKDYMSEGNNPDAPGFFIQWLISKADVYAHVFTGKWYDIGQFDQYNAAIDGFVQKK